jgi:hypothetical protein
MAEKKFFVDINLQGSALTNAKIGTNTGIGSTEGAFGYDSTAHRLQYFDGTATKEVANLSDIAAVTGGLILQGGYDAATDTPNITDGSAFKGFFWVVTETGTFLGESVQVGDSIIAKVDEAGATLSDWLILQGNVVIATDTVDGISRLATQTEANDGTESGAVVITPATLQGKIDAQITPEINSKVSKSGDTMSGNLDMGNNSISNANDIAANSVTTTSVATNQLTTNSIWAENGSEVFVASNIDFQDSVLPINLPAPTNDGDATNKTYVDGVGATAEQNAKDYADSLAPNYDAAGSAAQALTDAEAYTDTAVSALSGKITIPVSGWLSESTGYYQFIDTSAFGNHQLITQVVDANNTVIELDLVLDPNSTTVRSNILPSENFYLLVTKVF